MDELSWTTDAIPSLHGKTAIITGANSGIGLEAAGILAGKGAHIIMACRNLTKAARAQSHLLDLHPGASIEVMELDLSNLASVQAFAIAVKEKLVHLNLLINNAGLMALPYQTTSDGFEMQLGTNHLGHFALTAQIFPVLKNTPGSRIVNISSLMHWMGNINFENLNYEHGNYNPWEAYGQSKLANMLFTYELQHRIIKNKLSMLAVSAHPGYSATNLQQTSINHNETTWKRWMVSAGNSLLATSPLLGSLPTVYAATNETLSGGEYIGPSRWFNTRGVPGKNIFSAKAKDAAAAKRLWEVSEKLTRVSFPLEA